MKQLLYCFVLILLSKNLFSQVTTIPDSNFEQALIDLGYDTGTPDGSVPTANIENITVLSIEDKNISDLTGIEDFIALKTLRCYKNKITSLDITNNTKLYDLLCFKNELDSLDISKNSDLWRLNCESNNLTELNVSNNCLLSELDFSSNNISEIDLFKNTELYALKCHGNNLKELDVSKNPLISGISCGENHLTSLDLSNNLILDALSCWGNELTSLDLSLNKQLYLLYCQNNDLQYLNVKNGNNMNFWSMPPNRIPTFDASRNEDLACIEVDDASYSANYWADLVDSQTCFSINCNQGCMTSISEINDLPEILVYPNPTEGIITISFETMTMNSALTLSNILGQPILKQEVETAEKFNLEINANPGVYFLRLESSAGQFKIIKIIKK